VEGLNILMALLQAEAAAEGDIADVGHRDLGERGQAVHMMVGTDAFDRSHRPWTEPGARPVGDTQIHGYAHQRHAEALELALLNGFGAQRCVEHRGDALVWLGPASGARKHLLDDLAEFGVVGLARRRGRVARAEGVELLAVHLRGSIGALALPSSCSRLSRGPCLPAVICNCPAFRGNCTQDGADGRPRRFSAAREADPKVGSRLVQGWSRFGPGPGQVLVGVLPPPSAGQGGASPSPRGTPSRNPLRGLYRAQRVMCRAFS